MKNITIPDDVEKIGAKILKNCETLEQITIPASVKSIGSEAFKNCENLETVSVCWKKPIEISNTVFDYNNKGKILCSLYVPKGKIAFYESTAVWEDFAEILEWDANSQQPTPPSSPSLASASLPPRKAKSTSRAERKSFSKHLLCD